MAKGKQTIQVEGREIAIMQVGKEDYISLTDMVGEKGRSGAVIQNWMRNRNTLEFLGIWEKLFNPDFKVLEFEYFFSQSGLNRFTLSVKEWTQKTQAKGIYSKAGRGGGTYAHRDIAFEFGTFISPEFKLLLIRDYQRLKESEYKHLSQEWDYGRFLTKVNYRLHTDTIRDHILPRLQIPKNREWVAYAEEADLLNMAVFGQTAKQWREAHPEAAQKGNIRDFASIEELTVLANLEGLNAYLIRKGASKEGRYLALAEEAINQYKRLASYDNSGYIED